MPRLPRAKPRTISEIMRRDIFDSLTLENVDWAGRLEEPDFLARIYDLADMRSTDGRFNGTRGAPAAPMPAHRHAVRCPCNAAPFWA